MIDPVFANIFALENPLGLLIIAGVVVLLFGGNKLSTFGKSLGEGMKEFKKAVHDEPEQKPSSPMPTPAPAVDKAEETAKKD